MASHGQRTTAHIINHTHWDREWFLTSVYTSQWIPGLIEALERLVAANSGYTFFLDGQTLVPLLSDIRAPRAEPAIMAYAGHIAVRTNNHRFIRYTDGTTELYDRGEDPNEWNNQTDNPKYADIKTTLAGYLPATEEMAKPVRNPKKDPTPKDRRAFRVWASTRLDICPP